MGRSLRETPVTAAQRLRRAGCEGEGEMALEGRVPYTWRDRGSQSCLFPSPQHLPQTLSLLELKLTRNFDAILTQPILQEGHLPTHLLSFFSPQSLGLLSLYARGPP